MRAPWLLIYNCQASGLGHCLNLMCGEIEVDHYDPTGFTAHRERILERLDSYERILVAPKLETRFEADLAPAKDRIWRLPTIYFDGYHPDICFVSAAEKNLDAVLGGYHSLIAYAAFRAGLSEDRTRALYTHATYAGLGYFQRWEAAWTRLLAAFGSHGFDLSGRRAEWSRAGAFMHTVNHPRMHCLRNLALAILDRAGHKASYLEAMPHDNLANGPIYPVYPEIAVRLGIEGSYLFKPGGEYRYLQLDEFIAASFAIYRSAQAHDIRHDHAERFAAAIAGIRSTR